jgi:hypothetical protein
MIMGSLVRKHAEGSNMSAFDRPCDMLIPAQENLSNIVRINFVRINGVFCAFILTLKSPN